MNFDGLEKRIKHARSLSEPIEELGTDIVQLLKKGIGNTDTFLIYRDKEGNKTHLNYREFYDSVLDAARFFNPKIYKLGIRSPQFLIITGIRLCSILQLGSVD